MWRSTLTVTLAFLSSAPMSFSVNITFSRRLAIIGGILLPVLETIRRRHEFPGPFCTWDSWADDYVMGALLLIAAWKCRPPLYANAGWLAAAMAFACGIGLNSLLSQFHYWLDTTPFWTAARAATSGTDPSGL